MIVLEDRLKEIFDTLPDVVLGTSSFKPTFSFGDEKHLNAYIKATKNQSSIYPLIWLVYPNTEVHNYSERQLKSSVTLILAVRNKEVSWLNERRFKNTYSQILIPLLENVLKSFKGTKIASINRDTEGNLYRLTKFPNYGNTETNGDKHFTTDIWDAIRVEFDLTVNNCKIDIINY